MKLGRLVCNAQGNVGDDIQSIAASLHVPRIDVSIDESIHQYRGNEPVALVMNGWFSANSDRGRQPLQLTDIREFSCG